MNERNKIKFQKFQHNNNMTMSDSSKKNEEVTISLRKDKLFSNIMTKRQLRSNISIAENEISGLTKNILKSTHNEISSFKAKPESFPLLSQLSSPKNVLLQLKQSYYTQNKNELIKLLEEINYALNDNVMIEALTDNSVVMFIIKMFLSFDSELLFYICSSIMAHYTFITDFTSVQLNSVKVLDNIIYEVFNFYQKKEILTNILTIIWNIYNDLGNSIICQTQLFYYLCLWIITEEQLEYKFNDSLKEAILLNLYLLINSTSLSLKPQIHQIIPFLVNEVKNSSERNDNCEQLSFVLSILHFLSNDDEICQLILKEGVMNDLCELFQYLFLKEDEIYAKKTLVLHPKCIYRIVNLFNNFFCMTDTIIAEMLPEELFFSILMQLIKLYSKDSRQLLENGKLYSSNQGELMSLIANISACNITSLINFIGEQEELIKVILLSYSNNTETVIHIIHIIDNLFIRNNIKAINLLQKYHFMNIICNALSQNIFHSNVKIEALKVLIQIMSNIFESNQQYPFNFWFEFEERNMMYYIQILHDQSHDIQLVNCCLKIITMRSQIGSNI